MRSRAPAYAVSTGRVTWLTFQLAASVQNLSDHPLYLLGCDEAVEFQDQNGWASAWTPEFCAADSGDSEPLPPHASREVTVQVGAALAGPGGPAWRAPGTTGSFRLRISALSVPPGSGAPGHRATAKSALFTLHQAGS